jgi:hypothetical protein
MDKLEYKLFNVFVHSTSRSTIVLYPRYYCRQIHGDINQGKVESSLKGSLSGLPTRPCFFLSASCSLLITVSNESWYSCLRCMYLACCLSRCALSAASLITSQ